MSKQVDVIIVEVEHGLLAGSVSPSCNLHDAQTLALAWDLELVASKTFRRKSVLQR